MKKKKKEKKELNLTFLFHILVILLIISIIWAVKIVIDKKDVQTITKNAENIYTERVEDTNKAVNQAIQNKYKEKDLIPFESFKFKYTYNIAVQGGNLEELNFEIRLPADEPEKQYISDLKITPAPSKTFHDGTNIIASYNFTKVPAGNKNITVEGIAKVRTYDLKTAKILNKNLSPEKDLTRYLKPEQYIESDDSSIINIAKQIQGNSKEEIVNNVYKYTQKSLKYTIIPKTLGAKEALRIGKGKCSEFAAIMVAILRAKNIPSRIVCGVIARDNTEKHGWVEVYFDEYGWVAFDPTVQANVVNIMQDGKIIRQETIYDTDKSKLKYIASSRNYFSTWNYQYTKLPASKGIPRIYDTVETHKIN